MPRIRRVILRHFLERCPNLHVPGGPGVRFDTMLYEAIRCRPSTIRCSASSSSGTRTARMRWRAWTRARRIGDWRCNDDQGIASGTGSRRRCAGGAVPHRWLETWLENNFAAGGFDRRWRRHEEPIFVRRRRTHLRRGRRGHVAGSLLQEPVDHQRRARGEDQGRHRNLSRQRLVPDQVRSR
jgi:hypothetical protein